jgi:alpha-mannosidase
MPFQPSKITLTEIAGMLEKIEQSIYEPLADLSIVAWTSPEPLPFERREAGTRTEYKKGEKWGGLFDCGWFRFQGTVPPTATGNEIVLLLDLSGELLVVDDQGNPQQGLTTAASWYDFTLGKPGKKVFYPSRKLNPGDAVDVWADAGNNDLFGMLQNNGTVQEACIAAFHSDRNALYYDYWVLHDFMQQLPIGSARREKILFALWNAKQALVSFSPEDVAKARGFLARELNKKNGDVSLQFSAIGHAHLDLAWLWPVRESYRKGARTFSHILRMMERYPDFRFAASQAQLYQWMKDLYPALYTRVKKAIAEGRWDPITASWVEFDTNVPSGEALVRQLLYGKMYARKEFGIDVKSCLLPDSFGYTGALPQLLKKAGVEYLITTKTTWDRYNSYPHSTFFWAGIDGSKVLVHLPPEGTYNSPASPRVVKYAENEFQDKAVSEDALIVFGIGDGGGGPGVEHIERLLRERNLEGLPPVKMETIQQFVPRLDAAREWYHTWSGELYLACHQGTYTTQARNKRHNRLMEKGLHALEVVASTAAALNVKSYPAAALERIWKEMMLYQFHDILPGSSITRVYKETDERYPAMETEVGELLEEAVRSIVDSANTQVGPEPVGVFNTLSWKRSEWVVVPQKGWMQATVDPLGYAIVNAAVQPAPQALNIQATTERLENDKLVVEFNSDGTLRSVFDKENQREAIAPGEQANQLVVYDDRGDAWDYAWDYEYRVVGRFTLSKSEVSIDWPRAILTQHYKFGASTLSQRIILTTGSRRIDFETHADWQETGKMLRTLFPLNVQSNEVACEIQFGHIMRPTHRSSSWEKGMYEIPAHKWIDLSQRNYGVAIFKDCKYGHKASGHVIDINLLRSPVYPDPVADKGAHSFTYALYPHAGDHLAGGVIQAAYEMNFPLHVVPATPHAGRLPSSFSLASTDAPNVIIESVKKAEDGNGVILRLYESHGIDVRATVCIGIPVKRASLTNLLEEEIDQVKVEAGKAVVGLKPFEIVTLRVM